MSRLKLKLLRNDGGGATKLTFPVCASDLIDIGVFLFRSPSPIIESEEQTLGPNGHGHLPTGSLQT